MGNEPGLDISRRFWRQASLAVALALLAAGTLFRHAQAAARAESRTRVSLRLTQASATEAYERLGREAGVRLDFGALGVPAEVRLSTGLIQEPFWTAVVALNEPSGLRIRSVHRQPRMSVRLVPGRDPGSKSSVDGPYLGQMSVMDRGHSPDGAATARPVPQLLLKVYAEPAVRPLLLNALRVDELIDASGRAVAHVPADGSALPFERGVATALVELSARPAPLRLARMKLSGTVLAATRSELAEIGNLDDLRGTPSSVSAAGFTVGAVLRPRGRGHVITLTLTRTTASGPEWLRPASRLGLLEPVVVDVHGRALGVNVRALKWAGRTGTMVLETSSGAAPAEDRVPATDTPHKLMLEIPTDVTEHAVRLEFTDVPLH